LAGSIIFLTASGNAAGIPNSILCKIKNRPVLPGGLSVFIDRLSYSPLPKRRDHHPARRG
jgi:hypothetical protein